MVPPGRSTRRPGQLRASAHPKLRAPQPQSLQVKVGRGDLIGADVDAAEPCFGLSQRDLAEHRSHAAADLQQAFAGMQLQIDRQELAQQVGLLHEPALFPFAGAVDLRAGGMGGRGGDEGRRRPASLQLL